jgi:MEMO1 family protein
MGAGPGGTVGPAVRVRRPAVAGAFYPAQASSLQAQIAECFEGARGPGEVPRGPTDPRKPRRILAGVAPHAGYVFSGPVAAHLFARLARERPPATILILGVNHHGLGSRFAISDEAWSTPLGEVAPDLELVRALARGPVDLDPGAHRREHSIEVEVPWLQSIYPEGSFRLVALQVTFAPFVQLEELGRHIRRTIAGRDVLLLASSDLSHYLPRAEGRRADDRALDPLVRMDPEGLYRRVVSEDISMCGIAPTTALLCALAGTPAKAELVARGDSADAEPMNEVVGYASVLISSP